MTLFILSEFVANTVFAVLLVVSTPKISIILSGFNLVVAVPLSDKVGV
jgi:hypothetical protein